MAPTLPWSLIHSLLSSLCCLPASFFLYHSRLSSWFDLSCTFAHSDCLVLLVKVRLGAQTRWKRGGIVSNVLNRVGTAAVEMVSLKFGESWTFDVKRPSNIMHLFLTKTKQMVVALACLIFIGLRLTCQSAVGTASSDPPWVRGYVGTCLYWSF